MVMAALGYVFSPWAVLCWPGALLISYAFAGAGMAGTTYMRSWQDFDLVSLAISRCSSFRPPSTRITVYPGWLQVVVRCTPLYQGVALLRGFRPLGYSAGPWLGHAALSDGHGLTVGLAATVPTAGPVGSSLTPGGARNWLGHPPAPT